MVPEQAPIAPDFIFRNFRNDNCTLYPLRLAFGHPVLADSGT